MTEEPPLEPPNWLKELEAKRERRVKAKLGHETGAGAACLQCSDKCPGLDLHFWRKICKNCKCSKEDHDVPDDDIHGWAEWQLLGQKPNKIKTKITLPGRKGEVELEWAPKGQKDTVEKFLQTLPPESIPIKGSQAAVDRKMQLQKQIPVHDIDPGLCHDLTAQELEEMNKYVAHVKEKSVGVGQLVNLGNLIRGVIHHLDPQQAQILSQRFGKNVPIYEIVRLQGQLNAQQLAKDLGKMNINLPNYLPNNVNPEVVNLNPVKVANVGTKTMDFDNLEALRQQKPLPNYLPSKLNLYNENQSSTNIGNLKDLAYSTYDQYSPNHNQRLPKEDILQPNQVQIGPIRDIHPEIKSATFGQNENYIENLPKPQEASTTIIDDLVIPNCHRCQKPFKLEEFAVAIERSNSLFHANCFKCAGCDQILADNMYFYHKETNNIYCLRDYAKVKGYPRCKGCDELIFTKEYCLTEDNTFHLKHFCCIECDTPLAGQNYLVENSQPMCLPCYENSKANKCLGCRRVIKPDEKGLMLKDSHFHVSDECFCCAICRKPLLEQKLLFRNERLYCSHDCFQRDQ